MLSGETTIGRYPVECVKVLHRVALRIERSGGAGYAEDALLEDARQKLVASAVVLANSLAGSKLIVFTRRGIMARYVSNMRPARAPIFAFTPSDEVCRQLALCWGTCPIKTEFTRDPNKTIEGAEEFLRKSKLALPGDQFVIVSDLRAGETLVDCVQLRTLN
jgi:pyruvate kinase